MQVFAQGNVTLRLPLSHKLLHNLSPHPCAWLCSHAWSRPGLAYGHSQARRHAQRLVFTDLLNDPWLEEPVPLSPTPLCHLAPLIFGQEGVRFSTFALPRSRVLPYLWCSSGTRKHPVVPAPIATRTCNPEYVIPTRWHPHMVAFLTNVALCSPSSSRAWAGEDYTPLCYLRLMLSRTDRRLSTQPALRPPAGFEQASNRIFV